MEWLTILFISIGLSMDSFAVSIANGLAELKLDKTKVIKLALPLSMAQGVMPVLGWLIGMEISDSIKAYDHWIAFILLAAIGLKMIKDGFLASDDNRKLNISFTTVAIQSIATSIDALVVGVTFALLHYEIVIPSLIIAFITLVFSIIGLYIGKLVGRKIGKSFTFIGGALLFLIGTKILIEHLYFQQ